MLLERDRLTSGTTWHAAGLMVTLRLDVRDLDRDAQVHARPLRPARGRDRPVDRLQAGRLHRGRRPTTDRLEEYRRVVRVQPLCGVDVHEISPGEVAELFPLARTDDLLAGFYVAEDGRANPVDVTMALAKGARHAGRDDRRGRAGRPAS